MKVKVKSLSRVRLLETPWTEAHQAPLSMGFSKQEYWSGVPLSSPTPYVSIIQFVHSLPCFDRKHPFLFAGVNFSNCNLLKSPKAVDCYCIIYWF